MKLFIIGGAPSTHPVIGRTLFEATVMYIHKYFYTKERSVRVFNNASREEVVVYIYRPDGTEHYRCILEYCDQDVDWAQPVPEPIELPVRPSSRPKVVRDIVALFRGHRHVKDIFVDKRREEAPNNIEGYRIKVLVSDLAGFTPERHHLQRDGFRMVSNPSGPSYRGSYYYEIQKA